MFMTPQTGTSTPGRKNIHDLRWCTGRLRQLIRQRDLPVELPFEDPTWDGKLSVDALVLPDTAAHLAAVVVEVTATSAWCSLTNKYVHSTKLFFDAIGQATRKRRVLDEGFDAAGYQLPPTRASRNLPS